MGSKALRLAATLLTLMSLPSFAQSSDELALLPLAAGHVEIALESREEHQLWGRHGGSDAEVASAKLFADQLSTYLGPSELEPVRFEAYRPNRWALTTSTDVTLDSAVPAPFDARFPSVFDTTVVRIATPEDWSQATGAWAFVEATMDGSAARNSVRQQDLYQKAVDSGAIGLIFSLPTPPGFWQSAAPVDKPFTKIDLRYPDHRRPIPAYSISSDDGQRLIAAIADGARLSGSITYHDDRTQKGFNVVATLPAEGSTRNVLIFNHLDSFFTGANDDASGIAATVGIAKALSELPAEARFANFIFAGISAHHDEGAGMRAFVDQDPARIASIETAVLIEHVDAQFGDLGQQPDWPDRLNDFRAAYIGKSGWPGIDDRLETLVTESGVMTRAPLLIHDCIADLYVVCDDLQPFCLMQAPPYYHTNHDTIDKLSESGLRAAVDFHLRLLRTAGYIAPE